MSAPSRGTETQANEGLRDTGSAKAAPRYVTYYRVSTDRQGQSGLGLEAQHESVTQFVALQGGVVLAQFVEVESGKKKDRPELAAALAECRRHRATLLIAKLDRLARSVHFIAGLMDGGVEFVAADNPYANRLMLHLLAAFAEHEREVISIRTKAALAAAKARGARLGENGARLAVLYRGEALERARQLGPTVAEIKLRGVTTLRGIAKELNNSNIRGHRGAMWREGTVKRLLSRL
jgi:DNA invertase Pin-like site-specific DNA recombinase